MANQIRSEIPGGLDGERLDKALAIILDLSRAASRALIERGVSVDGSPARASDRVSAGSTVVSPEPEREQELTAEPVDFGVLYEDDQVVVVDKPAGLVVHPGSGRARGTLAAGLLHRYPEIEGVGAADRWGLVHRLDRDTSGALLVARTRAGYGSLSRQLSERTIERVYTALVDGLPGSPTGTIEAPIGRDPEVPTRQAVVQGGKHARTHYEVIQEFEPDNCALLRLRLETGRTHQIRVHLAAIDHPVIGDRTYGKPNTRVTAPRTFLHAASVGFDHPETGEWVVVESPLPQDLQSVLASLEGALA